MGLTAGGHFGAYEIIDPLGAGGMGEVYRATDTNLGRQVAIKVLSDTFANDPERLARFEREAKTLAALNHPNIAQIYGLEKAGGIRALVMELVEGPTLADHIAQGPIPVDEALPIAKQIAEALEAAHEQGIIHRDLKPANIKLRPDGTVKVLDFGLAKAIEPTGPTAMDATASPTITSPAMMTRVGVLLGTAAYMSPEQARGKVVDRRSDIWAFGCVLYEMFTGVRAFPGESVTDTLAAVLRAEPHWSAATAVPQPIQLLMHRCLEKELPKRLGHISIARFVLGEVDNLVDGRPAPIAQAPRSWRAVAATVAVAAAAALAGAVLVWLMVRPQTSPVERFAIAPPDPIGLAFGAGDRDLAVAPDGGTLFYLGNNRTQLFARPLGQLEAIPLATSRTPLVGLFTSPDGRWVGFSDGELKLQKVLSSGGPPVLLAQMGGFLRGATWLPSGDIVFATNGQGGLLRVSAEGGEVTVLTRADPRKGEADHLYPERLPGESLLFTISAVSGGAAAAQIAALDFASGTIRTLVRGGSHGRYVEPGYLVYTAGQTLRAVPFDPHRLEVVGTPVPVLSRLATTPEGGGQFDVSTNGTLVYGDASSTESLQTRTLIWIDRDGREELVPAPPRAYRHPRIAPDGSRAVLFSADDEQDLWMWHFRNQSLTRLTFDPAVDWYPLWTPDGSRIIFHSRRSEGLSDIFEQRADGTGGAVQVTRDGVGGIPTGMSPDGRHVVFFKVFAESGPDLILLERASPREPKAILQTRLEERDGVISPDGKWMAYFSNISGSFQVYVRPFPSVQSGQWQITTDGGRWPLWSRSGDELFYVVPGKAASVMSVPVAARNGSWSAGTPRKLFECQCFTEGFGRSYDISPDDRRFLMISQSADQRERSPQMVVVRNWVEELKRLVPTN